MYKSITVLLLLLCISCTLAAQGQNNRGSQETGNGDDNDNNNGNRGNRRGNHTTRHVQRYPLLLWSTTNSTAVSSKESQGPIYMNDALSIIRDFTDKTASTHMVVVVVEGMTSRDLIINAKDYPAL